MLGMQLVDWQPAHSRGEQLLSALTEHNESNVRSYECGGELLSALVSIPSTYLDRSIINIMSRPGGRYQKHAQIVCI